MNEIISSNEILYIKRRITSKIKEIIEQFPVTVITGARQVGKSTLLQHAFPEFCYHTLDDYAVLAKARLEPNMLLVEGERVIIDEAQKLPELFPAIKLLVDAAGSGRKIILSGSANLLLLQNVTESLAGRAFYLELGPLTLGEEQGILTAANFASLWVREAIDPGDHQGIDPLPLLLRGFMPAMLRFPRHEEVLRWLEGYVRTYLERDLRDLSQVDSLIDFRRLMQSLALRTGNLLNQADVARESQLSHPTTYRYIKLLEVSGIIKRVPAFAANRGKRLVKSSKLFFVDPALAIFLAGYFDRESLAASRELGGFFETLVHSHLHALCEAMTPRAHLYYWRTTAGREVDFIIEYGRRLLAVEVKLTANPTVRDIHHLLIFLEQYPETVRGILVHGGNRVEWLHPSVIAVPWWWLDM